MMPKRILVAVTAIVFLSIGIGAAVFIPPFLSIGGPRHPTQPKDLVELRRLAYSLSPAVGVLHERTKVGAVLPDSLKEVSELPAHFEESFPFLHYSKNGNSFTLRYKIGWDPCLVYDHRERIWIYDPGDGGDSTVIDL